MEKKTNKAKLEIFKFLRKSAESQGSWKVILGYFCMNSELQNNMHENSAKSYGFHKTNRKSLIFVNCLRFSLKLLSKKYSF